MQAGLLTEPIEIHRKSATKSIFGDEKFDWAFYLKTKAQIINVSGQRTEENHQIVYDYRKNFVVRYYIDVQDTDRLVYEGKNYRILNIDDDRKYQKKTITAEQIHE